MVDSEKDAAVAKKLGKGEEGRAWRGGGEVVSEKFEGLWLGGASFSFIP